MYLTMNLILIFIETDTNKYSNRNDSYRPFARKISNYIDLNVDSAKQILLFIA